jgi:ribonuclease BN (tRNA processing enzyme)
VKVTFYGTRGSLPSPGAATIRYGGNTSCLAVTNQAGQALILDAGSGIRVAGQSLSPDVKRVDVLLTHLHMDHIQGLGFFGPLYTPGVEVHFWGPPSTTRSLRKRLARYLSPPLFPVRFREVPSKVVCHDLSTDSFEIGDFRVRAHLITHPGPTLGYRVESDGRSMAYLPDHEPQLGCQGGLPRDEWLSGFSIAEGADLLVHDAQYTPDEYRQRVGWGHCTPELAVQYAEIVQARRLLFFHHDPGRSDEQLEQVCAEASALHKGEIGIAAAAEADTHEV